MARVNTLTSAYNLAHQEGGQKVLKALRVLANMVKERGYQNGDQLLAPGCKDQELRELCWNVSSFLQDEEVDRNLAHLLK